MALFVKHMTATCIFVSSNRCQGHRKDLPVDGKLSQFPCSRELTERLIEESLVKTLWDDYGIVSSKVYIKKQK